MPDPIGLPPATSPAHRTAGGHPVDGRNRISICWRHGRGETRCTRPAGCGIRVSEIRAGPCVYYSYVETAAGGQANISTEKTVLGQRPSA